MMTEQGSRADVLLSRLSGVQEFSNYWKAYCPAHDNTKTQALSVKEFDDGSIGIKCHASHTTGCTTEKILAAVGLSKSDLKISSRLTSAPLGSVPSEAATSETREERYYIYENENAEPMFRVHRTRDKRFFQQHWDGSRWQNGLADREPILYRLPEVIRAEATSWVFVVEGEKDADNLAALGLVATTSPMGAGKWRASYADTLKGRRVAIIPDNDEPGKAHAEAIKETLPGARILDLPVGPKGDVSDWLADGGTAAGLLALADKADRNGRITFESFTLGDLLAETFAPVRFIVEDLIPEGTMFFGGKPKMGKSWLAYGMAIAVASGTHALGYFEVDPGDALILALEDNKRRLNSRGEKLLTNLSGKIEHDVYKHLSLTTHAARLDEGLIEAIEHWCETAAAPRLVVIDTITRIRPRNEKDRRQLYEQDYEVGEKLTDVASTYGIALVPIGHLRKGDADDPLDLISGSTGLTGGMDGALVLKRTRGAADAILTGVHRELETDPDIAMKFEPTTGHWEYLGDAEEYMISKERRKILDALANGEGAMKPKEIAEATDMLTQNVSALLKKMLEDGMVDQPDYGYYNIANSQAAPATFGPGTHKETPKESKEDMTWG